MEKTINVPNFRAFCGETNQEKRSKYGVRFQHGHYNMGKPLNWEFYLQSSTIDQETLLAIVELEEKSPKVLRNRRLDLKLQVITGEKVVCATSKAYQDGASGHVLELNMSDLIEAADMGPLKFQLGLSSTQSTPLAKQVVAKGQVFDNKAQDDFASLLESGEGADLPLVVSLIKGRAGQVRHLAHMNILKLRTPRFAKLMEDTMTLTSANFVSLPGLTTNGLKIILQYIYTGMIDEHWEDYAEELAKASDKYDFKDLTEFLNQNFGRVCTENNVVALYKIAKKYNLSQAKHDIFEFVEHDMGALFKVMEAL